MNTNKLTAIRGAVLSFKADPFFHDMKDCLVYKEDAVIVMDTETAKIVKFGDSKDIIPTLDKQIEVKNYGKDSLIVPGFIDSHVHYPQTEMIAAYGEQLIDWLNNYTFIVEQGFKNKEHAKEVAEVFLKEQLRNGVTSATTYCTVFPQSVDAIFETAAKYNMKIMAGKVCMDRNAPEALLDTAQIAYDESTALINKWHGKGRAEYVITPRFAPTSTPDQLEAMKALADEHPDMMIQTHVSENINEVAWVKELFPQSKDAIFETAAKYNMKIMAGKVCMDRNAPEALLDTAQIAYDESTALINKWHGKGRAEYVITPRFAPTSTPDQLEAMKALADEHPDMMIQTHVSENINEVAWVKELFPQSKDYTDVYAKYNLVRRRAVYGHGIHLTERELDVFSETGAAVAHCPTSNFFLGSGYLNVRKLKDEKRPVHVGMGTDLGAGTSFSMLQTMNEAYKAAQMNGKPYTSLHAFFLAGKGTADALGLGDKLGQIKEGMDADIAVLNLKSTPIIEYRMKYAKDLEEALFIQMTLADDRAVSATYVAGKEVYSAK